MKKNIYCYTTFVILLFLCSFFMISCNTGINKVYAKESIDSLISLSHNYRYLSLDSFEKISNKAYELSEYYNDDCMYEVLCNMGFADYIRMDFHSSAEHYKRVLNNSDNELICFLADIGMMRVCCRTAMNKEFYDYHNSAIDRMERIKNDQNLMNDNQLKLWNYLKSEFHFVASSYFMLLKQDEQVNEHIEWLKKDELTNSDTTQLIHLNYLLGDYLYYKTDDENIRSLVRAMSLARIKSDVYFEALSLRGVVSMLVNDYNIHPETITYISRMIGAQNEDLDELKLYLAERSLYLAQNYGSLYDIAKSYIVMSDYWLHEGDYIKSLSYSNDALACVNFHHKIYCSRYGEHYVDFALKTDTLCPFTEEEDSMSVDMSWINDELVLTSSSLIADIREQFCKVYSAMGLKKEADYNRNIYLDILDGTRQDMRIQQRYEVLEEEEHIVNLMLLVVVFLLVVFCICIYLFTIRIKKKTFKQISKLYAVTDLCHKIISTIDMDEDCDETEIRKRLSDRVWNDIHCLFPFVDCLTFSVSRNNKGSKHDNELLEVLKSFYEWAVNNAVSYSMYEKERQRLLSEKFVHEKRFIEYNRENIAKCACLSIATGITPFLDRVINEIVKLKKCNNPILYKERFIYISELVDKINEYNENLSYWVKIKKGSVSQHIENFELQPLFQIVSKSKNTLGDKNINLVVHNTDSVVKADKALTLFMIHTLLDNAQKYTNPGGTITISSTESDGYVDISVTDTGCGIKPEDLDIIINGKAYDSSYISSVNNSGGEKKGYGFGLMNCKGIIDKYKKINSIFSVCGFFVESELGKGSKFSFRLPKGIMKSMYELLMIPFFLLSFIGCDFNDDVSTDISVKEWQPTDSLLIKASDYADQMYFSNVDGLYEDALCYADSVCFYLNQYTQKENMDTTFFVKIYDVSHMMPEIKLWNLEFNTDYHVILDLRNETAITALALNDWKLYEYNNDIYTRLYKLVSQDKLLEEYCNTLHRKNNDKHTLLVLIVVVIVLGVLVYVIMYYRHYLLHVFNMNQFVYFNGKMFSKTNDMNADFIYSGINDIHTAESLSLTFMNNADQCKIIFQHSLNTTEKDILEDYMKCCMAQKEVIIKSNGKIRIYPLLVNQKDATLAIGAMAIVFTNNTLSDDENMIIENISRFLAIRIYYSSVEINKMITNLEYLHDETRKAEMEESNIHVQNMVLDNCLSTIKHETIYYPSRIKVISDKIIGLISKNNCIADHEVQDELKKNIYSMSELANYYKDIFTLFCNHAFRQFERVFFRRSEFGADYLLQYAYKSFNLQYSMKKIPSLSISINPAEDKHTVIGDKKLMEYFIDNLFSLVLCINKPGNITMQYRVKGNFVEFSLTDNRIKLNDDYIQSMFHPDGLNYDSDSDTLVGYQNLICKQIIREHDEYGGRRGCRIYVENVDENKLGIKYVFTLPKKN